MTRALRERRPKPIIVRPLTIAHNGVRASVPFFLLEEEIDLLAEAAGSLAESRRFTSVGHQDIIGASEHCGYASRAKR